MLLPLIRYFYYESFLSFLIVQIFAYMYPRSFALIRFGSSFMPFCISVPFLFIFCFFCNTRLRGVRTRDGPWKFNVVVTQVLALCVASLMSRNVNTGA